MPVSLLVNLFLRYVLPAIVLAGGVYAAYDWAYDRGAHAKEAQLQPRIAQLAQELKDSNDAVAAARANAEAAGVAHETALRALRAEHVQLLATIRDRLNTATTTITALKERLNASTYITARSDAACTVPRGFILLHNEAAQASPADPAQAPQGAGVPASGPPDADAPSGVALSVVGSTVRDNYLTCAGDREALRTWQQWYRTAYSTWEKAVKEQGNWQVVVPLHAPAHPLQ